MKPDVPSPVRNPVSLLRRLGAFLPLLLVLLLIAVHVSTLWAKHLQEFYPPWLYQGHLRTEEDVLLANLAESIAEPPHKSDESAQTAHGSADPIMQAYVKLMMKTAWGDYYKNAREFDELIPYTQTGRNWASTGSLYLTAVDAIDTLYIMGLHKEYLQAKSLVAKMDFNKLKGEKVSVFETNIRALGGLLSIYELSGDNLYLDKAIDLANRLLESFKSKSGLPWPRVDLSTGEIERSESNPAELGTLQLEFQYLSDITGNTTYAQKALRVYQFLRDTKQPHLPGLIPEFLDPETGKFTSNVYPIGARADSYYEYLIKLYHVTKKPEFAELWELSTKSTMEYIETRSPSGKFTYLPNTEAYPNGTIIEKFSWFEELACFAGGMYALGSKILTGPATKAYLDLGQRVTETCYLSGASVASHIGPEIVRVKIGEQDDNQEAYDEYTEYTEKYKQRERNYKGVGTNGARGGKDNYKRLKMRRQDTLVQEIGNPSSTEEKLVPLNPLYQLRPETVESIFYMWRQTHKSQYRAWGRELALAFQRACRSHPGGGYHVLLDVDSTINAEPQNEPMHSFFLAETLKYLYLLFSSDDVISLDEYVFNTEAHPISIRGFGQRKDPKKWTSLEPFVKDDK